MRSIPQKCTLRRMAGSAESRAFSVTEITREIKGMLEDGFPDVTVQGEISNFRPSSTGHYYFSLKDSDSLLSAVMFRNRIDYVRFQPADGMLVRARGGVSVYGKRGTYQLICETLERAGEGDILLMLEERKRRLAAEGLFEESRKKPLPLYPSRVAVVTSPTGAAVRDILRILKRRASGIDVVILPAPVQGDGADERIARQIEIANAYSLAEVIIVGRGGGSLEDLLPFSSEVVVRAIAASRIPVVSAVGHETDFSLADLAADVRAPTPSAAAEIVAASSAELMDKLRRLAGSMDSSVRRGLEKTRLLMAHFSSDNLERSFRLFSGPFLMRVEDARQALEEAMKLTATGLRHRLELGAQGLASCSPLEILKRGYSVVTLEPSGKVLLSAGETAPRDRIAVRLAHGGLKAEVKETYGIEKL